MRMCASSPTVPSATTTVKKYAKKGGKAFVGGLEKVGIKLKGMSKESQSKIDAIDKLFAEASPIDGIILILGFYAGWHGHTPMTNIMGWIPGFGGAAGGQTTTSGSGFDWYKNNPMDPYRIAQGEAAQLTTKDVTTVIHHPADPPWHAYAWDETVTTKVAVEQTEKTAEQAVSAKILDSTKICMGCIGAIEAYMITRPGALAAMTGLVGDLAQAAATAAVGLAKAAAEVIPF